jgi:hypothetical protein
VELRTLFLKNRSQTATRLARAGVNPDRFYAHRKRKVAPQIISSFHVSAKEDFFAS